MHYIHYSMSSPKANDIHIHIYKRRETKFPLNDARELRFVWLLPLHV